MICIDVSLPAGDHIKIFAEESFDWSYAILVYVAEEPVADSVIDSVWAYSDDSGF